MNTSTRLFLKFKHKWQLLITAVSSCFSSKSKKLHWYDCQFYYKKKGADSYCVDFNMQIGLLKQNEILKGRIVKKLVGFRVRKFPKKVLDNGVFYFKINAYLGHFSK